LSSKALYSYFCQPALVHCSRSFSPQGHKEAQSFFVRLMSLWFKLKLAGYFRQPALLFGVNLPPACLEP
jgi:hypothetical protein